ncbi:YdcH family protein [Loktanella sp. DJP18]|uniref:YdcH family protein n=1 Tax=Loktanella sp. DJP18 TaxID=3409788 RepID=UPI003BB6BA5D
MTNNHPHTQALVEKHRTLDTQIEEAQRSPAIDTLEIAEMKRRKLALKEEIAAQPHH